MNTKRLTTLLGLGLVLFGMGMGVPYTPHVIYLWISLLGIFIVGVALLDIE